MQAMATSQDAFVDLHGLSFRYRDWGGHGRQLLLLHGLASNANFWNLAAPYLQEEFRVVALDQRGHGASAKPESGYNSPTFANDIATFIGVLELARPIIVGHSWGANVGMQVAADYPDLVSGLVCIDGGFFDPSSSPGATWAEVEKALEPPDFAALRLTWDDLVRTARSWGPGTYWGSRLEEFLQGNFEIQQDGTVLPQLRRERHMLVVRAIWDQRVSSIFSRVTCPVLLLPTRQKGLSYSSTDGKHNREVQIERAVSLLPQARVVWMEDSIHDVPVQRPAEIAAIIRDAILDGFSGHS